MRRLLILAGLIALALGSAHKPLKTKQVDADFVMRQKKVLSLLGKNYDMVGKDYNIEANIDNYTNKKAVEEFLTLYKMGFLPKSGEFSIYYNKIRDETIALFRLFYYAKDFETFYKTAAFAKLHLNERQFFYTFYTAVIQRPDTHGIVLPALYEEYPIFFLNWETLARIHRTKMQNGKWEWHNSPHGIIKENNYFVFYSNYSDALSYPNEEVRMSYFTEDVGLNSYYGLFNMHLPFWWNSEKYGVFKERRGEIYYYFYQQLLARYYLERLTNGLGEIPKFSWYAPLKTGYYPPLATANLPMAQRPNYYDLHIEQNYEFIRFLDSYEKTFFQFLQDGHFKAFDKEVDLHKSKAVNFVGNYWQTNADLYSEDFVTDYQYSYETIARRVLSGTPEPIDKYTFRPSALDFYLTSLRDPVTYQLYQRIVDYIIDFKEYLEPYTDEQLHFKGVELNDVKVDKLVTYFDYFDYNVSYSSYFAEDEVNYYPMNFVVRQPRLNHKPFTLSIEVKSELATDAIFKIFIGPKYDSNGFPITLEENWMKFYELHWFQYKLLPGVNKVKRESNEFMYFKDDSVSTNDIYRLLEEGKVPYDMSVLADNMPRRLMLPRGTEGGYPFQLFVFVYPFSQPSKEWEMYKGYIPDMKPFGYPLDRPLREVYFKQPNMIFKEVFVYHEGEMFPYKLNTPEYFKEYTSNIVPKD